MSVDKLRFEHVDFLRCTCYVATFQAIPERQKTNEKTLVSISFKTKLIKFIIPLRVSEKTIEREPVTHPHY